MPFGGPRDVKPLARDEAGGAFAPARHRKAADGAPFDVEGTAGEVDGERDDPGAAREAAAKGGAGAVAKRQNRGKFGIFSEGDPEIPFGGAGEAPLGERRRLGEAPDGDRRPVGEEEVETALGERRRFRGAAHEHRALGVVGELREPPRSEREAVIFAIGERPRADVDVVDAPLRLLEGGHAPAAPGRLPVGDRLDGRAREHAKPRRSPQARRRTRRRHRRFHEQFRLVVHKHIRVGPFAADRRAAKQRRSANERGKDGKNAHNGTLAESRRQENAEATRQPVPWGEHRVGCQPPERTHSCGDREAAAKGGATCASERASEREKVSEKMSEIYAWIQEAALERNLSLAPMGPRASKEIVDKAKQIFVEGEPRVWWLSLSKPHRSISSAAISMLDVLGSGTSLWFIPETEEDELLAYDTTSDVVEILRNNCPLFEYYVVDKNFQSLLIETDHDQFVLCDA